MKKTSLIVIVAIVVAGFLLINFLPELTRESGVYVIDTPHGKIKIRLYDETPIHKENFMKMVKEKFYNNTPVEVIYSNEVLIAGGSDAENAAEKRGEILKAEMNDKLIPKKGTIAAYFGTDKGTTADDRFFLINGHVYSKEELVSVEKRKLEMGLQNDPEGLELLKKREMYQYSHKEDSAAIIDAQIKGIVETKYSAGLGKLFSKEDIEVYTKEGGVADIHGEVTVFGEVTEGMDVLEKILALEVDRSNKPVEPISFNIK